MLLVVYLVLDGNTLIGNVDEFTLLTAHATKLAQVLLIDHSNEELGSLYP